MIKQKPNIIVPFDDKARVNSFVLQVINDAWIYSHTPDSISLSGDLFTLTLVNKKFVFDLMGIDNLEDYVDIYLTGIKLTGYSYTVTDNGTNIIIEFSESITLSPELVVAGDFTVKGKIVSR